MAGRLTLVAGSGTLVPYVIGAAQAAGYEVQVLAVKPREDLRDIKVKPLDLRNPLGVIATVRSFRTTHIAMAGGIVISDAVREGLQKFAGGGKGTHAAQGDAALAGLGGVLKTLTGAQLVGVHELAPDLLTPEGHLAGPAPNQDVATAARFALDTARAIGQLDIGQAAVVSGRRVLAVEDIGGTDALLARIGAFRTAGLAGDGRLPLVLAKAVKPQQPLFADLPATGPATLINMASAGVQVLALDAGRTLMLERPAMLAEAERLGITILALPRGHG